MNTSVDGSCGQSGDLADGLAQKRNEKERSMPYVKVTGYVEVPDEHYDESAPSMLTDDGLREIDYVAAGDLEDLKIERDDRPGLEG
jgi:hypothetical protein